MPNIIGPRIKIYDSKSVVNYPHRLGGTVKANGTPSPNRRVVVIDRNNLAYICSALTDAAGNWLLTHLADRSATPDKVLVVVFDDDSISPNYNAVVADKITQVT